MFILLLVFIQTNLTGIVAQRTNSLCNLKKIDQVVLFSSSVLTVMVVLVNSRLISNSQESSFLSHRNAWTIGMCHVSYCHLNFQVYINNIMQFGNLWTLGDYTHPNLKYFHEDIWKLILYFCTQWKTTIILSNHYVLSLLSLVKWYSIHTIVKLLLMSDPRFTATNNI